jgi:hypothetical protein
MQYALLFYTTETFDALPPAVRQDWLSQMAAWRQSLADAGVLRGGLRLAPSTTATSLRRDGGEMLISDGPFAETKEILAGFMLIDCADLDSALAWAQRCPIAQIGTVEVRPEHPEGPARAGAARSEPA